MGHYDECREGYCSKCGQRSGWCEHTMEAVKPTPSISERTTRIFLENKPIRLDMSEQLTRENKVLVEKLERIEKAYRDIGLTNNGFFKVLDEVFNPKPTVKRLDDAWNEEK